MTTRTTYEKCIAIRNECNNIVKKAKKEYERKISNDNKSRSNPKGFGNYGQERMKVNTGINTFETM